MRWRAHVLAWLFCALAFAWPAAASAEAWGQYMVVIDDSGSMNGSDPRRLTVLASLALAGGLSDADQVMLVGLNELADGRVTGPRFVSPRDLLEGRDGAEGTRPVPSEVSQRIGHHEGGTPCSKALSRARDILQSVSAAGAPQTLLMLTDGACNGGPVESAERWLAGLRSHEQGRFRFVMLTSRGKHKPDKNLLAYAAATGWRGDARVDFDVRTLLRAFADVLSFSRGLVYDDGGRVGLERTFAGAREVRVLAISESGNERIELAQLAGGEESKIEGGPTWRHSEHAWSFRVAKRAPADEPFATRSPSAGTDVLVIPSYGELRVEAVVAPCGEAPALPWTRERPVRAGQPACAWARLVGDTSETIERGTSFDFDLDICADESCTDATAMQPAPNGTFNAQLGAELPIGRHERVFRAHQGALAVPVIERRGFSAVAFGVQTVSRTPDDTPLDALDLGVLPSANPQTITLKVSGAFPAAARAKLACRVDADEDTNACVKCLPESPEVQLQDPVTVQLRVAGTAYCPVLNDVEGGELPLRLELGLAPLGEAADQLQPFVFPMSATLAHAKSTEQEASVVGGDEAEVEIEVPAARAGEVSVAVTVDDAPEGFVVETDESVRMGATDAGQTTTLSLRLRAKDCCAPGEYRGTVVLTPDSGGPSARVPVVFAVQDPGWWTCPGKLIAKWVAGIAAGLFLLWVVRGFVSPARFSEQAVLAFAETHNELSKMGEDDMGWRKVSAYEGVGRGFYRPGRLRLGGAEAVLPSLREYGEDAHIEASPRGGAALVVHTSGVERFSESGGWEAVDAGKHPVHGSLVLRRGETYLMFRR